ncbi:hypothetical protein [Mycolicibacterium llatzerense]|uniref:hypothetical protein n=1 Tax=Mycolicibacterium llatzerense TaxID=280871 RepID=UPI0005BD7D03|nr:hypothetical protein [Mycolicibacterium llatzerense]
MAVVDFSPQSLPPMTVGATSARDHQRLGQPYVVVMSPELAGRAAGHLRLTYLTRSFDPTHRLGVLAYVIADRGCSGTQMRCDQTIRTALGMPTILPAVSPVIEGLAVEPVYASYRNRLRSLTSVITGRRYVMLRAAPPKPADIEKDLCRIRSDDLAAIGTNPGSLVLLFAAKADKKGRRALSVVAAKALALGSDEIAQRRDDQEQTRDRLWDARYRCPKQILGVVGDDLSPLWLDSDARQRLGIQQLSPILVRRDTRSSLTRQSQEFGVALLTSFLTLQAIIAPLTTHWNAGARSLSSFAISLLGALSLIVWRLRTDIR